MNARSLQMLADIFGSDRQVSAMAKMLTVAIKGILSERDILIDARAGKFEEIPVGSDRLKNLEALFVAAENFAELNEENKAALDKKIKFKIDSRPIFTPADNFHPEAWIEQAKRMDDESKAMIILWNRWAKALEDRAVDGVIDFGLYARPLMGELMAELNYTSDHTTPFEIVYSHGIAHLAEAWLYGQTFVKWHNSLYGVEGEEADEKGTTVNSFMIKVGGGMSPEGQEYLQTEEGKRQYAEMKEREAQETEGMDGKLDCGDPECENCHPKDETPSVN